MLLRGLFENYKIPIWYRFDTALTPEELLEIIKKIEAAGFHVVAVTCDMGKSNQKCAKDLGVTLEHPFFENPCRPGSNVHWFYDPCHVLKGPFIYCVGTCRGGGGQKMPSFAYFHY